ncbi:hypothetical protein OG741_37335 [Streptomyces sp. NBC_01410]|uniref:hypothetical protein n=1 Tax=Streptomyces sp. NBC_01410 TaxID=2903856 RepID=UPI00324B21E6
MSSISARVNDVSPSLFGEFTAKSGARELSDLTPVMATPAAFAAGVAVGVTAYALGYAVGAAGGSGGGIPQPRPKPDPS